MGKCLIIKGADFSAVAAEHISIEDPRVVISVVASPSGGGTTTGTGSYNPGQSVTITATPADGYIFTGWSDGNTNASRTIVVGNSAETYTAEFMLEVELLNTITGAYLNDSGVVSGEGSPSFAAYTVKFYKVNVDRVRITRSTGGAGGVGVSAWALYSGIDSDNRGTGFIRKSSASTTDTIDDIVDTSVNKYIGVTNKPGVQGSADIVIEYEPE